MATAETIPLAELLAPIPGNLPAGDSLRADTTAGSLYYKIKDARAAARAAERAAFQLGELEAAGQADWAPVMELAPRILRERAKDLEICAWYIEALVRRKGFAGLRDGFKLARGLIDAYWDTLHPMPDEDGMATRMAPLTGLNGDDSEGILIVPIGLVPLTERTEHGEFSTWHYQQSGELAKLLDAAQREQRLTAGAVPLERIVAAISSTSADFLRKQSEDLAQCRAEFGLLSQALDAKAKTDAPPTSSIAAALDRATDALNFLARGVLASPADGAAAAPAGAGGPAAPARAGGPVQTRDEALRALAQIAEFFRRTEPHSPVPYGIERAVRWAGLPLPTLIEELIPDTSARSDFHKLTGIQPPPSS
ncbi:MAG TPA: type VI secretion system protein TssA [Planctomycetota bacterium]|nr:type VI secretion system protein TssA [Planctomycetota bacterium]